MTQRKTIIAFLALVLGGGTLVGLVNAPDAWYFALEKPPFNPPAWVFGPVWTALYIMIAIAGRRIWGAARRSVAMQLWWTQLALNFFWTFVFFTAHRLDAAFAVVLALLASVLGFVVAAWRIDRMAAWLFVPYAAWVAFAALLNGALWALN